MKLAAAEIARAIADHQASCSENMIYAVRSDDAVKRIGSICRRSRNLADWRDDCKKLPGTSGTLIGDCLTDYTDVECLVDEIAKALELNAEYIGKHTYIIAGNRHWSDDGDDDREVVLSTDHPDCFCRDYKGAQVVCIVD